MSGPTDSRDLHTRLADHIRAQIETGVLKPGDQLPTLGALTEQHLVSLTVVRAAIADLAAQGLVVTRQGVGSFVRERPRTRRHGQDRYRRSVWKGQGLPLATVEAANQGMEGGQRIRELADVPAPPAVAERLNIAVGTLVFVRRRTTYLDGRPNQLADSYYELAVVEGTRIREEDTGPGGGFARLEEAGYPLTEIEEEFISRAPIGPELVALELPPGTHVIDMYRTTFSSPVPYGTPGAPPPRPVEVMHSRMSADMVAFYNRFPIPD